MLDYFDGSIIVRQIVRYDLFPHECTGSQIFIILFIFGCILFLWRIGLLRYSYLGVNRNIDGGLSNLRFLL